MFTGAQKGFKKNAMRLASLLLTVILLIQLLGIDITALGASPYAFRGYNNENIAAGTFGYVYSSDTTVSGSTVIMDDDDVGEAIGFIKLNETDANISDAIDLGGLEIDFSTTAIVSAEGEAGADNDIPVVDIYFCRDSNFSGPDGANVISIETLTKADPTAAGSEVLSSGARIPVGTRALFVYLTGTNTISGSDNTVEFNNLSLVIYDTTPPTCEVEYDDSWTSGSVLVTITASDDDSGLEGIYVDGIRESETSPYTFTASENTSFSAYSKDLSGKVSDTVNKTIDNIDTGIPAMPDPMTLSHDAWTNTDVTVSMPALGAPSGSSEKYVYQIGSGAWQDFENPLTVSDNGISNIKVAVEDAAGNRSDPVSDEIYIDKLRPSIDSVDQTVSSGSCTVSVDVSDAGLSEINELKYATGSRTEAYFESGGTAIMGGTFTVTTGGAFTIFVSDNAGNYDIDEYIVRTAPTLANITDTTVIEDGDITIPLTVSDNETAREDLDITATASNPTLIPTLTVNQTADAVSLFIEPAPEQYGGPVTITVEVEDETGEVTSKTFNISVSSENDSPVAVDDTISVPEDGSVTIDVLSNDADTADGDTLTVSDPGTPAHGTASIDEDGKIVYTPSVNYNGSDSFTYTISDGNGGNATATVYVTVEPVGDGPIANNDVASTDEDENVTINVLANDTDADLNDPDSAEALTIVSAAPGAHGTTEILNGKIVYKPEENWSGVDQFSYTIEDKTFAQSTAYVTVTVSAVNDAPKFSGLNETKTYTIAEDAEDETISFAITDVETEADSLMLHAASLDETLLPSNNLSVSGLGNDEAAVSLVLTPAAEKFGTMTIRLSLGDGFRTVTQDITLIITGVNDAPTAQDDTLYFDEDTTLTFDVSELLENDTDIEGDAISFGGIASEVERGTLTAVDADTYEYAPPTDFDGTTTFTYYATDGEGSSAGTCELIARARNDAPTLTIPEGSYTTNEDTSKADIVFNISDLETTAAQLLVTAGSADTELVSTNGITITNNGDGTCTMRVAPMPDAHGTDVITVTVSDGGKKKSESFNLIIASMPDKPVAVDDEVYVPLSGRMTFDVLENDRDVDGDSLTVAGYDDSLLPGHLVFNESTQMFTYYAQVGETGESAFTYTVSDGDETTENAMATVTLDVHAVTHAPSISAISNKYIMEDGNTGNIPFSVTDSDYGDEITITISSSNTDLLPVNYTTHTIVTDNGDGTYSLYLEPKANAYGTTTVTVTATDKALKTDAETLVLRVYAQNDAPEANDDAYETEEDNAIELSVLSNDSDPEEDAIYVSYMEWPEHGTLSRSGNVYTYTPHGNFNGTETLTYLVSDGRATAPATVTITVTPVNDAPVARSNWAEVANTPGASVTFNVLGNDYDVDSDEFVIREIITPDDFRGEVVINGDGTLTYTRVTASILDNGRDDFQYTIVDIDPITGEQLRVSNIATVYIGVDFVSSLTAYTHSVYCQEDADPFIIDLTGYIANPNGVDYVLTIDDTTDLGTFTVIDNTHVRFTPVLNANGYQSITYSVTEVGGGEHASSTIGLRVYPVNDAPVIDSAPDAISCDEDDSATFTVTFSDVDDDVDSLYLAAYGTNSVSDGPIPLTVSIDRSRTGGSADITVMPTADTFGEFDIEVYVSDGFLSDVHTVHMKVNPVDDLPVPEDVSEALYEDTSITFYGFTADCDVDGDDLILSISEENGPQNGTAVVNADHTITYTPDENYFGTEVFKINLTDDTAAGLTGEATVTLTVISINDPPRITNLGYYYTTNEDTPKVITLTVTDVDDDMTGASSYTFTSDNPDLIPLGNISIAHVSGSGMAITLTPTEDNFGVAHIGVTATDGELSTYREFQLTVLSINDVPVAVDDTAEVDEDIHVPAEETSVVIDLTANDSDVEDTDLEIASIDNETFGRVINNNDGTVTYYVDGDHSGTETFDYTVMDSNGATDTAEVTVVITAKNDPPLAKDDAATATEDDEDVSIDVLGNDSDTEGDALTVASVSIPPNGTATTDGDVVFYTPDEDYYGTDTLTYTVSDGNGGTATGMVTIRIASVNDDPTIAKHSSNPDDWEMDEDTTASFNFVIDDVETAFHNLIVEIESLEETRIKTTCIKLKNGDGYKIMTVTPELNQTGTVPISISVTDGIATKTETFYIEILGINDAPVLTAPAVTTDEDTAVGGSVSAADVENDPLTYEKATDPAHGTVTVYENGTYTYHPAENYNGPDSFDVTVSDGTDEDTQTVHVTVTPVNDPPTAVEDARTISEDGEVTIDVLANDYDVDADEDLNAEPDTTELTYSLDNILYDDEEIDDIILVDPAHGTISISGEGLIVYTPSANYNGTDTFEYNVFDAAGTFDTGTVTITISAVNDAPSVREDYTKTIKEDHTATIPLTDVVGDVDGDTLTVEIDENGSNGIAVVIGGNFIYTPTANWFGNDSFTYTVTDGTLSNDGTVHVVVESENDDPLFDETPATMNLVEDGANGTGELTVSDIETLDELLVVSVVSSSNTDLVSTDDVLLESNLDGTWDVTVNPRDNKNDVKNGAATITLKVTDGEGSNTCTFVVNVSAVNDAPSDDRDDISVFEDGSKTYNAISDDDVDLNNEGDTLTITNVSTPSDGTAVSNGDGTITYTPTANFNGSDAFAYTVQDAAGLSVTVPVYVTVIPVNDDPVISPDPLPNLTTDEDNESDTYTFTVEDLEDDNSTLSVSVEAITNADLIDTIVMGTVSGSSRSFTIIPADDLNGTARVRITVRDSDVVIPGIATAEFDFIVNEVNDGPQNGDDLDESTDEDTPVDIDVLANDDVDTGHEGDALTITAISTPENGTATENADHTIKYDPDDDWNGVDTFTYTVEDEDGLFNTFDVRVTVNPVNDAPVVELVEEQTTYTVDEEADTISIEFTVTDVDNDAACGTTEIDIMPSTDNYILVRDGLAIRDNTGFSRYIDVTPYRKWNGTAEITITADDGDKTDSVSFTYIVNSVNDTPVGDDVNTSIQEDHIYTVSWDHITDDADIATNDDVLTVEITTLASHGTASVDGGNITYKPNDDWNGTDSFVYTVTDLEGASDTGTITLMVTPEPDNPVADNESTTLDEDTYVLIDVIDGDTDVDANDTINTHPDAHPELQTLGISIEGAGLTAPSHGEIAIDEATGEIVYTPDEHYNGTDSFTYYVVDNTSRTGEGTVNVTIDQVNDAPVADDDTATTDEDEQISIDVLDGDTDVDQRGDLNANPDAEVLSISIDEPGLLAALNGRIDVVSGEIVYTPNANWFGVDKFEYNVDDGEELDTGLVTVTVRSVNDKPVFTEKPDNMSLTEDLENGVDTFSVTDVETDDADLVVTASSNNPGLIGVGDITIEKLGDGNRRITVDPKDDQNGTTTITLVVKDGDNETNVEVCTFTVTVEAVNDPPEGGNDEAETEEDTAVTIAATSNDDVDEDTNEDDENLLIISVDDPAHGTAAATNGDTDILYTPDDDWNGVEAFNYTVEDADGVQATFSVTVTVTPEPDDPVADNDSETTDEDHAVSIDVLDGDSDVDASATLNTHENAHPELQTLSIDIENAELTAPVHGDISINELTGEIVYTPDAEYNGSDSFTYYLVDNTGRKDEGTVTVTIEQVNDAPTVNADEATTQEDHAVTIDVLFNDADIDIISSDNEDDLHDKEDMLVTQVQNGTYGTTEIVEDGAKVKYTPNHDFFGTDTFRYDMSDGHGGTGYATVTVTVSPVNDAPIIVETLSNKTTNEDTATGAITFTVYDVDDEEAVLTATAAHDDTPDGLLQDITVGTDEIDAAARSFVIYPKLNQSGTSQITVTVEDDDHASTYKTFTLTVTPDNDRPEGDDVTTSIDEDTIYTIAWAGITHDADIATNGDVLSVEITTPAGHGTAVVDDANIKYTPNANFNDVDSFVYTVSDGELTDIGTITLTVLPSNDGPTADDVNDSIDEDTAYTVDWTTITHDPDVVTDGDILEVTITAQGIHGNASVDGNIITYTPTGHYNGSDSFVYTVSDGSLTDAGTISLTIDQVNDDPDARDDSDTTTEETAVTIDVLDNDTDVDAVSELNEDDLHSDDDLVITTAGNGTHGTTRIVSGGKQIEYTPNLDYSGTDTFTYTISDGRGGTDTATVTVLVGGENDLPVAQDDTISTDEDEEVSYNVLDNDTDADGDTLSFVEFLSDVSAFGTIEATPEGVVTFTPKANYNGSFDVGYRISDGFVTDTATITIEVATVDDAPVAHGASEITLEDTPLNINTAPLISDVDDTDDSNLTVTVEADGQPSHGFVSISGLTITYTPDAAYNGADSFVYTVTDNTGLEAAATVTISVTPDNDAPVARDDTATTDEDVPVSIDVLSNDSDVDTDTDLNAVPQGPISIGALGTPVHGSVRTEDGKIVYTPVENYNGTDSFTYDATDGSLSAQATVTVAIGQVNDSPAAVDDTAQTTDGDSVTVSVLKNDTDVDAITASNGDELHSLNDLKITGVSKPAHGTAVIKGKTVVYTAGTRYVGADAFTYTISDGHGGRATATVRVTVLSANDPPDTPVVHTPAGGEVVGGNSVIAVTWTGSDIDGDALSYTLEYYDGTAWHVVANGLTSTTYDFHIPSAQRTTSRLRFRVKANDGEFTSGYGYSGNVTVDKDAPFDIVVAMRTTDGSAYTAGSWTNQSVTVTATDITDISEVGFSYALEDMDFTAGDDITVASGVHNVFINAEDIFGNADTFGGYRVRIDKMNPVAPGYAITLDGGNAVVSLTLNSDPGGSGNRYLILPDGTRVAAADGITWATDKNGTYEFEIGDVAGNSATFTVTVDVVDETPPTISCDTNGYSYGDTSPEMLRASLTYSDAESAVAVKGFAVSDNETYTGAYQSYAGDITIGDGQFYIHALAENAFGLRTYETFGPFIVEITEPIPEVGESPVKGNVRVVAEDLGEGAKQIRMPGGEWSDELVLEDIEPGTYIVEVMDEDGNVSLVEITITDEEVAAGLWNVEKEGGLPVWQWFVIGAAGLLVLFLLILLLAWNVRITVLDAQGKLVRKIRKLRRRKDEVMVDVARRRVRGGVGGTVTLARAFTKRMRGYTLVVAVDGQTVFSARIPEDAEERFEAQIDSF